MYRPALVAGLVAACSAPAFAIDPPTTSTRHDLHGHLLPDGAIARLGDAGQRTVRTREFTFSHDGRFVARHRDSGIDIRELATGRDVTPSYLAGLRSASLFFAPDGRHIVIETGRGLCRIYDPESGQVACDLGMDGRHPWYAAVSRNGRAAFVRWYDGRGGAAITLFDLSQSNRPAGRDILAGQQGYACLSVDGSTLYAATEFGARAFVTSTGKELPRPQSRQLTQVYGVTLSPDGKTLAAAHADNLRLYPVSATGVGEPLLLPPVDVRGGMTWADSSRELLVSCRDAVIRLDGKTGQLLGQITSEESIGRGPLALSPDGRFAADVGNTESASIWDIRTGKVVYRYPDRPPLVHVFSIDARTAVTLSTTLQVEVWNLADGRLVSSRSLEAQRRGHWPICQFAPNGQRAAVYESDSQAVQICDVKTGRVLRNADTWTHSFPTGFGFSPDGDRLVLASGGRVNLGNSTTGRLLHELPGDGLAAGFSPDGRVIAVLDRNQVRLVEVMTNRVRRTMAVPDIPLDGKDIRFTAGRIRFSRDGSRLTVFGSCYRVWVWAVATGELLYEDRGDRTNLYSDVWSGDVSNDGRWLVYPSEDGTGIRLIDLSNPRPGIGVSTGHKSRITDLTFSPDDSRIITASADGTALVWDVGILASKLRTKAVDFPGIESLWNALADQDAEKAGRAIEGFARNPTSSAVFLAERLTPVAVPDGADIRRLVGELDSPTFQDRDQAERHLQEYRELAMPELTAALKQPQSPEHRARLERLLDQANGLEFKPERVRALRAIEVLERIGGTDAQRTLERLATGAPHSHLTHEARTALTRMKANHATPQR